MSGRLGWNILSTYFEVAALQSSKAEGQSGITPFTFQVTRSGFLQAEHAIDWWIATDGSASSASSSDFAGSQWGRITFAPGETERLITIGVIGDTSRENNETFYVAIGGLLPGTGVGGRSYAVSTILADEPVLTVRTASQEIGEGHSATTPVTFTVTRSGDTARWDWTGWWVVPASGSTIDRTDFAGGVIPGGTIAFAPGETVQTITVNLAADRVREGHERFTLQFGNLSPGLVMAADAPVVTVLDEPAIYMEAGEVALAEGRAGSTAFTFKVGRSGDLSGWDWAWWSVAGSGPAPAKAEDFAGGVLPSGSVVFAPGEIWKPITVGIRGDGAREAAEAFTLKLAWPSPGLLIGLDEVTGRILPDEPTAWVHATGIWKAEGQSGRTRFEVTVLREGDSSDWDWTDWWVAPTGATPVDAADFGGWMPWGTVAFAPGERWKTVAFDVIGDTLREGDEEFTVNLGNPSPALAYTTSWVRGRILADEPTAWLHATDIWRAEGQAGRTIFSATVLRDGDAGGRDRTDWWIAPTGSKPVDAADFGGAFPWGSVTFEPGERWKTITFEVAGDLRIEGDESFTLNLGNPSPGLGYTTGWVEGRIFEDEPVLSIAPLAAERAEPGAGTAAFTFVLTRSGPSAAAASVGWSVQGSGPNPASAADFGGVLPSGRIDFAAGQTSRTLTVNVAADGAMEGAERFAVQLSDPSSAAIGTGRAEGTILADRPGFTIVPANASALEGDYATVAPLTFTVLLNAPQASDVSVRWAVTGTGASPAAFRDFSGEVLPSGMLTIPAGATSATITVPVQGERDVEAAETFRVTLSAPSAGMAIHGASATGTILPDDTQISVVDGRVVIVEPDSGEGALSFRLQRSGRVDLAETVSWSVGPYTGLRSVTASDFPGGVLPSGSVTFAAGETERTVNVRVRGDVTAEQHEYLHFNLLQAAPRTILFDGTGLILDSDTPGLARLDVTARRASVAEGGAGATQPVAFALTRTGPLDSYEWVNWRVVVGGGIDRSDFTPNTVLFGTESFVPGEDELKIELPIAGDAWAEADEAIVLQVTGLSSGLGPGTLETRTVILNDDAAL